MNLREIDRLVDKHVMNSNMVIWEETPYLRARMKRDDEIPHYTTNIADAWQVAEKLRETKIFSLYDAWDEDDNKIFCAVFEYNDTYHVVDYKGYADTAPLAICLAALKSVGIEVEVNEQ
jgi:hypothetical protein